MLPFQENFDFHVARNKAQAWRTTDCLSVSHSPDTGPGVDGLGEHRTAEALRPPSASPRQVSPRPAGWGQGSKGPGLAAARPGWAAPGSRRRLRARSRLGEAGGLAGRPGGLGPAAGPGERAEAGSLTPSPALALSGRSRRGLWRSQSAWSAAAARAAHAAPVRARLSPGAAPFRGAARLACRLCRLCRRSARAGDRAGAGPPGVGRPRSGTALRARLPARVPYVTPGPRAGRGG